MAQHLNFLRERHGLAARALLPLLGLLAGAGFADAVAQPGTRGPQKGDVIVVRGCLKGNSLEAAELKSAEGSELPSNGMTFRLTGEKALLKQLKEEHDARVVSVEGVLKSDLPKETVTSRRIGGVRIGIGSPETNPGSREAESRRSVPVLQVKSFDGSTIVCGR